MAGLGEDGMFLDIVQGTPTHCTYDADPDVAGKAYYQRGGFFLTPSTDDFDTSFSGIPSREARAMDPAQRVMLETCWEGFERGRYTGEQLRGSQTGI
ncbi:hypothetical protein VTH82DRAFT_3929 [Thermothelomyces myriococcoides]